MARGRGCAIAVVVAAVAGGAVLAAIVFLGLKMFAGEVQVELQKHPAILRHIGTIQKLDLQLGASMDAEGDEEFVFKIRGDKGSGTLTATCVTNAKGDEEVTAGTLRLDSGVTVDLFPPAASPGKAPTPEAAPK